MGFSNYNGTDVEYEKEKEKKKFVLTRGKLILIVLILLIIIISVIFIVVKSKQKKEVYSIDDFKYLESRMIEEAPNYLHQKQIELTNDEYQIDLKELLEENGGVINTSTVKAAKICNGYVSAIKKENSEYKAYIKCNDLYTTKGYLKKEDKKTTTKKEKDKTKPVVSLIGEKEITINTSEEYVEQGAKAIDNIDGDITSQIKITGKVENHKSGVYEIVYSVTDSSNNKSEEVRIVNVVDIVPTTTLPKITTTSPKITTHKKTTKKTTVKTNTPTRTTTTTKKNVSRPIITLKGKEKIILTIGDTYKEPGYTAIDGLGKDITSKVKVTNNINTKEPETYWVNYEVTDDYGNTSSIKRFVLVKSKDKSVTSISLTPDNQTIEKGDSLNLKVGYQPGDATNKTVTFKSSNTNVATVDSNGVVKAINKGEVYITATSYNGKTARIKVIVTN